MGVSPAARPADAPSIAVVAGLIALAALRALGAWAPNAWWWGASSGFASAALELAPWLLMLACLLPSVGRSLLEPASGFARIAARHRTWTAVLVALAAALLVGTLEDRTQFLGDFALRMGTLDRGADVRQLFPQAMPLDVLAHVRLPEWLARVAHLEPSWTQRLLGALDAGMLALAALEIAAALEARGAVAMAVFATIWAGGYLALFTGYGKGLAELTALTAAAAAAALTVLRSGRGLVRLALVVALALGFHRAGVLLVPMAFAALWFAPAGGGKRERTLALALLGTALAVLGPRWIGVFTGFDLPHHFASRSASALEPSALGMRAADLLNAALRLAPLSPLAWVLIPALARASVRERRVLAALALPALALFLTVRPQQGVFRDLDVFAPSAVVFSVVTAFGIARFMAESPPRTWLTPALILASLAPSLGWLIVLHRPEWSRPGIEAFVAGPPIRPAAERAAIWDFLGTRALALRRPEVAAPAFAQAAAAASSPRLLYEWGTAELMRGRLATADSLFRRAALRDPDFAPAWRGLASTASWLGDTLVCAEAERRLERLDPGAPELPALRSYLARIRQPGMAR